MYNELMGTSKTTIPPAVPKAMREISDVERIEIWWWPI